MRICAVELSDARRSLSRCGASIYVRSARREKLRAIRQRISIQERLHGRHRHRARISKHCTGTIARNVCQRRLRQPQSKSLIRKEKEGFILPERTAESPAKIILTLFRFFQALAVDEQMPRLENIFPQ